jgi:hypothetical protein
MSGIQRRNQISGQFSARLIEMLESPAYQVLSRSAHRVISRIEIELAHHGGNDNGRLPVTYKDFIEYGVDRAAVAPAIREAEALGFIRVTERGRGGNSEYRHPNLFFLTFAFGRTNGGDRPTHDWRKIKTIADAEAIAREARSNTDSAVVAKGRRYAQTRAQKQKSDAGNRQGSVAEPPIEDAGPPMGDSPTSGSPEKPISLSISRVRDRSERFTEIASEVDTEAVSSIQDVERKSIAADSGHP